MAISGSANVASPESTLEPPGDNWSFAPGEEIVPGRRAQHLLGGGDRYEAWVAWNDRMMAPTVLKLLRPSLVADARARRAIATEGEVLARLHHPGLTRLFDRDSDGPRPFLEIEFVDGPRLSTLVRRHGRLAPEQAFPLARQLAATLHYLHSERLLHLDVKPGNVIMGPVPRLIDLSVARRFENVPLIRSQVGTDAYMAPEQCDPALFGRIGPASDSWGLGVTLYESLARHLPHPRGRRGGSTHERFPQLARPAAPLQPERYSQRLADVVARCLAHDPTDRPLPAELFVEFDDLAARAGVGRLRTR
jgi:serine/threonine protein kinase